MAGPIEILTFTSLYPNAANTTHGVFVENRLRHLLATGCVNARVIAPVPWFPSILPVAGRFAQYAAAPHHEVRGGIAVHHPRYLVIPKIGMQISPATMYAAARPLALKLQREREFQLIDAHYFYPDGVAAARLARKLRKPLVITARGTDVNLIPQFPGPRRMIVEAAGTAAAIIAVSRALKDALVDLGVPQERVRVLRNGVDLVQFRPDEREATRARLGLRGATLLSVGHLVERKGHHLVIGALPFLPDYRLLIAGDGPERLALTNLARTLRVEDRVWFLGNVPHTELHKYYAGADALVLASSREGWPNVLLEAMACGTPVVASDIWGNPEVVASREAGVLMDQRTERGVAAAVTKLFTALPMRAATRRYAEQFSWDATSAGQVQLFREILDARSGRQGDRANDRAPASNPFAAPS